MSRPKVPLSTRIWKHIKKGQPNDCWLWQGSTTPSGYGRVRDDESRITLAHRVTVKTVKTITTDFCHGVKVQVDLIGDNDNLRVAQGLITQKTGVGQPQTTHRLWGSSIDTLIGLHTALGILLQHFEELGINLKRPDEEAG